MWKTVQIELERPPDLAQRPGPEEKLVVNKPNTGYYRGPNRGQARKFFDMNEGFSSHGKSSKRFIGSIALCQLFLLPNSSWHPK